MTKGFSCDVDFPLALNAGKDLKTACHCIKKVPNAEAKNEVAQRLEFVNGIPEADDATVACPIQRHSFISTPSLPDPTRDQYSPLEGPSTISINAWQAFSLVAISNGVHTPGGEDPKPLTRRTQREIDAQAAYDSRY